MARVLIIEDNPANLKLMSLLLRSFGHEVTTATGGEQGVARALAAPFDVVLCDLQMPEVDGYEVLRRLDAQPGGRPAPVVAVTALAMVGDRERVLRAGFDGYVPKPIAPDTFTQQIEELLLTGRGGPAELLPRLGLPAAVAVEAPAGDGPLVLAVDDSPWNLELLRMVLQPEGYRVATATSIHEALAAARAATPALVIGDVHMPCGGGFALAERLRDEPGLANVPVLFLTSSYTTQLPAGALPPGVMSRPSDPRELLALVRRHVPLPEG